MKLAARRVMWMLPLFLTACVPFHKKEPPEQLLPPIEDIQPFELAPSPAALPAAAMTIPNQPLESDTRVMPPPRPVRRRRPISSKPQETPPAQVVAENAAVPAIGQLSSGEPSDLRQQTTEAITSIERGLSGIGRKLSDSEEKTATQIREYLKQAKTALATGDVDGAHTLTAKAKVLLGELNP